jgi:hypothetical protein
VRTSGPRTAELPTLDALGRVGIYRMPSIYPQSIHAPPTVLNSEALDGWRWRTRGTGSIFFCAAFSETWAMGRGRASVFNCSRRL